MVDSNFKVCFLVAADSVGIEKVLGGLGVRLFPWLLANPLENQFSDIYLNLFRVLIVVLIKT